MLSNLDSIHISAVLEDCADQLAILGHIMPSSLEGRLDSNQIVDDELGEILQGQKDIEMRYESLLNQREEMKGQQNLSKVLDSDARVKSAAHSLRDGKQALNASFKQNPLTSDNLMKIQEDRKFLQDVIEETLAEVINKNTFESLVNAVTMEKEKKAKLQQTILKEEESRKLVKSLQKQLVEVNKEKENEVQQRNEMIAHLKDQLQEMKAKTSMEGKYIKKDAEVRVSCTMKRCQQSENSLKEELETLKYKIDEEARVNAEIEAYLKQHHQLLEEKVEYWMEKYDHDVEQKQHELDVLKASKANDLARLQELTQKYSEYEKVVIEDRVEKEKARRQAEQEAEELRMTIKIQSWWRGVMVRRQLGPYSKKKKKKGKKGKKSGKKGKKKK
ncbi:dynein regulatory complex protein 9 [Exaiptasia diaphana]|uniref:Dynein regulatory complex protein 9 n=1 Tax=Exaiptasia diaphana TaxID=2652724 RepID=A0A913XL08_EXADI|nr:dynein regulatory complex protein 9 [Exaiptasia diaphana]XP_020906083.1 dynein regulatory complex protein 9 [Exaiptasia diaphana]KXJ11117.1 IQ domain-containing protein G [Exaiptasia diaphana]